MDYWAHLHFKGGLKKSGRPGSNRRHSAWKADALPTELLPRVDKYTISFLYF